MTQHVVRQGECLSRIASHYGFPDYRTLYDHPKNAEFKRKRPNPNLIYPGDLLFIPDRNTKEVAVSAGASHRFKLKGPGRTLHLRLRDLEGEPLRNAPYVLELPGEVREGQTDGDGVVDERVPMGVENATLSMEGMSWALQIGHLNPLDEVDGDVSGVQARLKNLGYDPGAIDGRLNDRTRAAIRAFQADHDLEADGEPSQALRDKLSDEYGC